MVGVLTLDPFCPLSWVDKVQEGWMPHDALFFIALWFGQGPQFTGL